MCTTARSKIAASSATAGRAVADIARASRLADAVSLSAADHCRAAPWLAIMTILILGGTAEARQLAAALVADGIDVISSLAGRVRHPSLPAGRVRIGGFGGADGLADVPASISTHPRWWTQPILSPRRSARNALAAASRTGTPLVRLERPSWSDHPHAGSWTWVADAAAARAAAESARQAIPDDGTAVAARLRRLGRSRCPGPARRSAQHANTATLDSDHVARAVQLCRRTPAPRRARH